MTIMNIVNLLNNRSIRNGGLFSIFSFFTRGISFVLIMLLAKYISPNEYGELSLFNTFVMFLGYFVGLSSAGYLSVSFFKKTDDDFYKDFTAIIIITVLVTITLLLLSLTFSSWLSDMLRIPIPLIFVGLFISFFDTFVQLNLDYLRVQEKISWYGVLSCTFALVNFVITLYLVINKNLNWRGRVYAQFLCEVIFFLIALTYFIKRGLFVLPKKWIYYRTILFWGIPLIPHLAANWMKQGLDRYFISGFHDMADVGLFSFSFNLANIIIIVGVAFNQTNSVSIYRILSNVDISKEQKWANLKKKERIFLSVYTILALAIAIGGTILVPIVIPQYIASIPYFWILSCFGLAQCVYFVFCNYLFYYDKTRQLMYITFGLAILHVLLSYIFTRYSLYYTCIISVISQLIITLLVYVKSNRVLRNNLLK